MTTIFLRRQLRWLIVTSRFYTVFYSIKRFLFCPVPCIGSLPFPSSGSILTFPKDYNKRELAIQVPLEKMALEIKGIHKGKGWWFVEVWGHTSEVTVSKSNVRNPMPICWKMGNWLGQDGPHFCLKLKFLLNA